MLVFDAKYKRAGAKPGRDDEYQMFAYSHLIGRTGQPTTALALVYPTNDTAPALEPSEEPAETEPESEAAVVAVRGVRPPEWPRGTIAGGSAGAPVLFMLKLPFPGSANLLPGAWPVYIDGVTKQLEEFIASIDSDRGQVSEAISARA